MHFHQLFFRLLILKMSYLRDVQTLIFLYCYLLSIFLPCSTVQCLVVIESKEQTIYHFVLLLSTKIRLSIQCIPLIVPAV